MHCFFLALTSVACFLGCMKLTMAKGLGESCCGGQTLFSQLCPIQLQLLIGKQVVDGEKSFRSFFIVSSYDFHWEAKESLTKQLKLLKIKKKQRSK